MLEKYPFKLRELPYKYNEIEPYIDEKTIILHHDKHLKNYVDKLNLTLTPYPKLYNLTLIELLKNLDALPNEIKERVRNNGGGVYNHNLYFEGIRRGNINNVPKGMLADKINEQYINFSNLYTNFKKKALKVFGSGYAWLALDENNNLVIIGTKNQDTILNLNMCPIILIDVWEHAYYLKYNNRREEYIDNYKYIINWDEAEKRYIKCINKQT